MTTAYLPLISTGFLLGWSVAWPPGPINAEIARRCLASGFWAGFGVLLGACTGDALWAILVSLGVGVLLTGPATRLAMGLVSVALLLALAFVFLKSALGSMRAERAVVAAPSRFDSRRASFLLGASMALTSPWNVAFWLAAIGRPEMTRFGTAALLVVAAAVIAGALTWGLIWSTAVVLLRNRVSEGNGRRWWDVAVKGLTGILMLVFAVLSAHSLWTGG